MGYAEQSRGFGASRADKGREFQDRDNIMWAGQDAEEGTGDRVGGWSQPRLNCFSPPVGLAIRLLGLSMASLALSEQV